MLNFLQTSQRYLSVRVAGAAALLALCLLLGATSSLALAQPVRAHGAGATACMQTYTVTSGTVQGESNGAKYTLSFTQYATYDPNGKYCGKMYARTTLTRKGSDPVGGQLIVMLSDSSNAGYSDYLDTPAGGSITVPRATTEASLQAECAQTVPWFSPNNWDTSSHLAIEQYFPRVCAPATLPAQPASPVR